MGQFVRKDQCPACAKQGRDKSGNNLAVYSDDSVYCFSCGYTGKGDNMTQKETSTVDITKYGSYEIRSLEHKPISEEICKRYGVRVVTNVETGGIDGVLYPYYRGDDLVGYKVRNMPKRFSYRGDSSGIGLFGQQLFRKGGQMLLVVEGEDDALAVAEMLKRRGKNYSVVSIPVGADQNGVLDSKIKQNYDFLTRFDRVVLCFDNDQPGQATAKAMADWLAPSTTVKLAQIPEPYKDAADMLVADAIDEFWKVLTDSREYSPEGIMTGADIDFESVLQSPEKGYLTPYRDLDDKLKGFRKGELVLLTAGSGIGKSTIAREIGYHFVKEHKLRVANIYLEEPMEKTALGYVALDNDVPLSKIWMDRGAVPRDKMQESWTELVDNGRNFFFKHFGSLDNETLMSKFRYYANALDVDFIFLDHISMVISGQEGDNERKTIDLLMTDLAKFCNETGVGVIAVVHLKRKNTSGKDKSLNEGGQVSLTDLRGSGGLEQLSWSVIALERNQQDVEESNFSTVRVLKNRIFGFTGEAGKLFFDPTTGRLLPAPEPEKYYEEAEDDKPLNTFE